MTSWNLRARSAALVNGDMVTDWAEATLVERFNQPDTLLVAGTPERLRPLLVPGGGCTFEDEDGVRFSGPLTEYAKTGENTWTATFASDLIHLWGRICYPSPGADWEEQAADYDVRTGPAETVMLGFANANAGPGARPNRRVLGLTVPASAGRGGTVKITARFDNLGQLLLDTGEAAGLRLRLMPSGSGLAATVTAVADLSARARYGTALEGGPGQLAAGWTMSVSRPTSNHALVAGGGEGAARVLREAVDAAAESLWAARVETFVDQRQTTDLTELDKAGADELAGAASPISITGGITDLDEMRLITDIPVGSVVGVDVGGQFITDRLRQVTTVIGAESQTVSGVIGSSDAGLTVDQKRYLQQSKAIRKVQAR